MDTRWESCGGCSVEKFGFIATLLLLLSPWQVATFACTTAVISGKATVDGRPLLWKNRDRSPVHNEVVLLTSGKLRATAVVNAGSRKSVWMGVNEAGFCIENSLSTDLGMDNPEGPGNGPFMYQALVTCSTVDDFRKMLEQSNVTGRSTQTNYGVIDAQGGAAIFETSATNFKMFDANDPAIAPQGFIVRSNFSMTGQKVTTSLSPEQVAEFPSSERYLRAQELLNERLDHGIDLKFIVRNCMRDLADDHGCCVPGSVNQLDDSLPEFVATKNTISRSTTVSAVAFQGVAAGEDPRLTTMWVAIGDPKFSLVVPTWASCHELSEQLLADDRGSFTYLTETFREKFFDQERNGISTVGLPQCWQELWACEDEILETTQRNLALWRGELIQPEKLATAHQAAACKAYRSLLSAHRQVLPVDTNP